MLYKVTGKFRNGKTTVTIACTTFAPLADHARHEIEKAYGFDPETCAWIEPLRAAVLPVSDSSTVAK